MYICIIDNQLGNIYSVCNALKNLKVDFKVSRKKNIIKKSDGIIFPGVGSFPAAIDNLRKFQIYDLILKELEKKKPFLGICLGMQILMSFSEEIKKTKGLNFINGEVRKFPEKKNLKLPHVGWNKINKTKNNFLLKGIDENASFYFDHSYYVSIGNQKTITSKSNYGINFVSSCYKDNVCGVQFHPEKSQLNGNIILQNFFNFVRNKA